MNDAGGGTRGVLAGVFAVSLAGIALEILLLRVFALRWSHHFAHLVIGCGLIGFGASGTLLALAGARMRRFGATSLVVIAWGFAVATTVLVPWASSIEFAPERLLVDVQVGALSVQLIAVLLPFLFVGSYVGLSLQMAKRTAARVYSFSLVGSALGAPLAVLSLHAWEPEEVIGTLGCLGVVAALSVGVRQWRVHLVGGVLWLAACVTAVVGPTTEPSEYKDISLTIGFPDARLLATRSGPLGRLEVVESSLIRYSPGRSLNATDPLPRQSGIFLDGNQFGAVTHLDCDPRDVSIFGELLTSLPFRLEKGGHCLVLGAGGGFEMIQALHTGMDVVALEMNPDVTELMTGPLAVFSGGLFRRGDVSVVQTEARGYLSTCGDRYDLIVFPPSAAFGTSGVSGFSAGENRLYTTEAFHEAIECLSDDGIVAASTWLRPPAREGLRLLATGVVALEEAGIRNPGAHVIACRDWSALVVLCRRSPWSTEEITWVGDWLASRSFDWVYYPGISAGETNRYHSFPEASYALGMERLLSASRDDFFHEYPFDVRPATDDRPFFAHTLKAGSLEVLRRELGGDLIPLGDWSELLFVASAVVAVVLAFVLLLVPLAVLEGTRWLRRESTHPRPWRAYIYFGAIGFGYLTVEISLLQRFAFFLAEPIHATALVLGMLLLASGLGSRMAGRSADPLRAGRRALVSIVVCGSLYAFCVPEFLDVFHGSPKPVRWLVVLVLVAPVGLWMGFPFPVALERLARNDPDDIAWAWAWNGFASVVAATAAALIALRWGYTAVAVTGVLAYGVALVLRPRPI